MKLRISHAVADRSIPGRGRVLEGESFQGIEVVRETRDGRQIDVSISAAPLRDAHGLVVGAMAVHEDVSGRKWAARELLRVREGQTPSGV